MLLFTLHVHASSSIPFFSHMLRKEKIYSGKIHFERIHFRKLHIRKMHFRKIHFIEEKIEKVEEKLRKTAGSWCT